VLNAHLH